MAKNTVKSNVTSSATVTTTTTYTIGKKLYIIFQPEDTIKSVFIFIADRCGCCLALTTVFIILLVVVAGICVRFFVENPLSSIILISLIIFLCILGVIVLTTLEVRRRRAKAQVKTVTLRNGGKTYYNIQPTAPQEDSSWEYSNRKTLPA